MNNTELAVTTTRVRATLIANPTLIHCGSALIAATYNPHHAQRIAELLERWGLADVPDNAEEATP